MPPSDGPAPPRVGQRLPAGVLYPSVLGGARSSGSSSDPQPLPDCVRLFARERENVAQEDAFLSVALERMIIGRLTPGWRLRP